MYDLKFKICITYVHTYCTRAPLPERSQPHATCYGHAASGHRLYVGGTAE